MSSKPALINLVKGKHKSFFDRFLAWALSAGRVIIIVTEIIALSAFLYRFSLDREIIDLRDNTKQEQKILELFKEQEKTFRNLQERLSFASELASSSKRNVGLFFEITDLIPQDITTTSLALTTKSMSIKANTRSGESLKTLIQSIKKLPDVQTTILDKIDNRISTSTIAFSLNIVFKK
ncbi:MAG: hypothetical protein A3J69_00725 [Candidatus Levybacteria bacterium RIFCSPHIGHO2_02_FULL_42_12]|nr:MAG: hypothetical protein A3J69_00725 [Candidatus Levybacteria bacterium RIFCSPHIGHO2_02_FULL_42_12]OGH43068.1 MAG: hypothetical protein A3B53_03075 [Candidatus Levybacteria bacterium RIFCSPLOWO2_01_FULL_42_15]